MFCTKPHYTGGGKEEQLFGDTNTSTFIKSPKHTPHKDFKSEHKLQNKVVLVMKGYLTNY